MTKICSFGKQIKKTLVDIEQTQEWLINQVREDTGLYMDRSYLYKIMAGKLSSPKIVRSICKILEIEPPNNEK